MKQAGFTLIEILIAMTILLVGLVGILALFPVGLDATRKSVEDSNSAIIAESAYASLRTAVREYYVLTGPPIQGILPYRHDGINSGANTFILTNLTNTNSIGIPSANNGTQTSVASGTYADNLREPDYCKLGRGAPTGSTEYNITPINAAYDTQNDILTLAGDASADEWDQWRQYSFNIELLCTTANPAGLFDVIIRIRRGTKVIKKFYTQIAIL
jgi:prepilin-type N-terminal cleavage/methylation domain-containing protein